MLAERAAALVLQVPLVFQIPWVVMAEQGCVAPLPAQEYFMLAVAEVLLVKQLHHLFQALVAGEEAVAVEFMVTVKWKEIQVVMERQT
jgi:hypothetical protein